MLLQSLYENRLNKYFNASELNRKLNKSLRKTEDRVFAVAVWLINIKAPRDVEGDLTRLVYSLKQVSFFKDLISNQKRLDHCKKLFSYAVQNNKTKFLKSFIEVRDELTHEEIVALSRKKFSELIIFYWDKQKVNLNIDNLKFAIKYHLTEVISHIAKTKPGLISNSICLEYLELSLEESALNYLEVKRKSTTDYIDFEEFMQMAIEERLLKVTNWIKEYTNLQNSDYYDAQKRELFYKSCAYDHLIAESFLPFVDANNINLDKLSKGLSHLDDDFKSFYKNNKGFLEKAYKPWTKLPLIKRIFEEWKFFEILIKAIIKKHSTLDQLINFCINAFEEDDIAGFSLYHDLINYFKDNIKLELVDGIFNEYNLHFELVKIIFIKFKESWTDSWYSYLFRRSNKSFTDILSMQEIANQDKKRDFFEYLIQASENQMIKEYLKVVDADTAKEIVSITIWNACSMRSWEIIEILLDYQPEMVNQRLNSTLLFEAAANRDARVLKNILNKIDENRFPNLIEEISKAFMQALGCDCYENALILIEKGADIKKFIIPELKEIHKKVSEEITNDKAQDWLEAILNCKQSSNQLLEQCVLPCIQKGASVNSLLDYKSINIFNQLIESKGSIDIKLTDKALKNLDLHSLLGKPQYSDFKIIIKDTYKKISIPVNSSILLNRSDYFAGQFNENWKKSTNKHIVFDMKDYVTSGITAVDFENAIKSIYFLKNITISESNFKYYLKLANFFQINHFKEELAVWVEKSDLHSHYKKHLTPALSKTKLDGQEMPPAKKAKLQD